MPRLFVLHSLRHTYLTRLGLAGVDAFTIMKLAGHGSLRVSQRDIHPTPQAMEDAVARLDKMNAHSIESKARTAMSEIRPKVVMMTKTPLQFSLHLPRPSAVSR